MSVKKFSKVMLLAFFMVLNGSGIALRAEETQLMHYLSQPHMSINTLKFILKDESEKKNINQQQEGSGNTAFLILTANNTIKGQEKISLMQEMINNGARVDTSNAQGENALTLTAKLYDPGVLKFLLQSPDILAILEHETPNKKTVLFEVVEDAARRSNYGASELMVKALVEAGAKDASGDALRLAARENLLGCVKLLANNSTINTQDSAGNTALMLAAGLLHYDVVKFLIAQNADTTVKNNQGQDAYHLMLARSPWVSENDITGKILEKTSEYCCKLTNQNECYAMCHEETTCTKAERLRFNDNQELFYCHPETKKFER